ncbi:MAG: molybdenum cofactor cytidylyltransferase [Gemmatimonadetes bacterium]|nr:molybdenum cofactor cytidylyltransferase [Gemmatimonadota bacterium]
MIAGLLLAAGGATRFGSQKLIAPFNGTPLVRQAADALARATDAVIVVVGNDATAVRDALRDSQARFVENSDWATGLASSLRCGVAALGPEVEAVVVALGDQPGIDSAVIREVVEIWRKAQSPIVATRYAGVRGHPVLFDRAVFGELAGLTGDVGAKPILDRSLDRVAYLDLAVAVPRDVDTRRDLDVLNSGA